MNTVIIADNAGRVGIGQADGEKMPGKKGDCHWALRLCDRLATIRPVTVTWYVSEPPMYRLRPYHRIALPALSGDKTSVRREKKFGASRIKLKEFNHFPKGLNSFTKELNSFVKEFNSFTKRLNSFRKEFNLFEKLRQERKRFAGR